WIDLQGRWVLVTHDGGACPRGCLDKLVAMRQVRLALGREAPRVERLLVLDDAAPLSAEVPAAFPGMLVVREPAAAATTGDRDHIHLVDPHGNVILRWPAEP